MSKGVKVGLILMVIFFGVMVSFFTLDPTVVSKIETDNPRTQMNVTEHILTGQKDWWYNVKDGVGNFKP